jgi:putative nucleotidyltransferase with HDIG domain
MKNILSKIRNNHESIFKIFLFLVTLFIIVYFFPRQINFKYEYSKGKPWLEETIITPFDFPILKSEKELKKEIKEVKNENKPVFIFKQDVFENTGVKFIQDFEEKWANNRKINKDKRFTFFNLFKKENEKNTTEKYTLANFGLSILEHLYIKGIVQLSDDLQWKEESFRILLQKENLAEIKNLEDLFTINSAVDYINSIHQLSEQETEFLTPLLIDALSQNVFYDEISTKKMLDYELENIISSRGMLQKGQIVIQKGELVNDEKYQILFSYQEEFENQHWSKASVNFVLLGQVLLVFVAFLILFLFLKQYRPEVLHDLAKTTMILLLIIVMILVTSFVVKWNVKFLYVVPFCILPIVLKAFFDTRLALFTHLISVLIIGFIVPNGFEFVYVQLIAGIVSILTILQMYKRVHLFISAIKIIGIYWLTYFALEITHEGSILHINLEKFLYFVGSGILTLLAYPLIFAFEKMFSLVSDVSLLELSDTNSKLLRKLANEASGTFQHSLQVANLAEEGIIEIKGNALLVRAGALYHDIGKLKNPLYFIENQSSEINPHDELEFDESADIILNHVKNGVEIANEYNLPEELIDFIRTHHGTTTVQYFYKQFISNFPNEEVDIKDFTYPGPKPFSKETAVLMIADSVEAAARSIKQPNADNINDLVENIINKQIEEGQFMNADITLKEISKIKKLYKKKLVNIHHARVEY